MQNLVSAAIDPLVRVRTAWTGPAGCKVLAYHRIAHLPEELDQNCLAVAPEDFHAQMQLVRRYGFRTITLSRFIKAMEGGPVLPELAFLITFDSGCRDLYDTALPILQEFGFTASVFLSTERSAGDPDLFLTLHHVAELLESGWEIGSHGLTHTDLTALDPARSRREIGRSKLRLEGLLHTLRGATQRSVDAFCYPWGRTTPALTEQVRAAGYRVAFGNDPGPVRVGDDPYRVKRIEINALDTMQTFWRKWNGGYNWLASLRALRRRQGKSVRGRRTA